MWAQGGKWRARRLTAGIGFVLYIRKLRSRVGLLVLIHVACRWQSQPRRPLLTRSFGNVGGGQSPKIVPFSLKDTAEQGLGLGVGQSQTLRSGSPLSLPWTPRQSCTRLPTSPIVGDILFFTGSSCSVFLSSFAHTAALTLKLPSWPGFGPPRAVTISVL